jgi:hypothetical protein
VGAWLSRYVRESSTNSTATDVFVELIGVTPIRVLRFPLGLYRSRFGELRQIVKPVTLTIPPARREVREHAHVA